MNKYVAFLRGINVGGNKKVSMSDLKKAFEELDFQKVNTLLNSGNIVFESTKKSPSAHVIEKKLEQAIGFNIAVILRPFRDIDDMIRSDHFKDINVTSETRLYVTLLDKPYRGGLKIPYTVEGFNIISVTHDTVYSVLTVSPKRGTTDAMRILEKEFGKLITTRNWNTIGKISKK